MGTPFITEAQLEKKFQEKQEGSYKEIVDTVNKGIEDGDIEAGGIKIHYFNSPTNLTEEIYNSINIGDFVKMTWGPGYLFEVQYKGIEYVPQSGSWLPAVSGSGYLGGTGYYFLTWIQYNITQEKLNNSPGTKLYRHQITVSNNPYPQSFYLYSDYPNQLTFDSLISLLNGNYVSGTSVALMTCDNKIFVTTLEDNVKHLFVYKPSGVDESGRLTLIDAFSSNDFTNIISDTVTEP